MIENQYLKFEECQPNIIIKCKNHSPYTLILRYTLAALLTIETTY